MWGWGVTVQGVWTVMMGQIGDRRGMRQGFTTGTCGAAAALAAATLLFEKKTLSEVRLTAPKGICLRIPVAEAEAGDGFASCGVIKDAGDDPDVTDGALVRVIVSQQPKEPRPTEDLRLTEESRPAKAPRLTEASRSAESPGGPGRTGDREGPGAGGPWYTYHAKEGEQEPFSLFLRGGRGIGIVTKGGLSCPVGMWAINPVPREMIFGQAASVCRRCRVSGPVYLTIEILEGERLAEKTFNPRLGIIGGLSVLGTTGIVEPMSEEALLETIRLEIRQKAMEGQGRGRILLVTPGNYGERFAAEHLGLSIADGVKCSNHIGASIDMAAEAGVERLLLVGHAGKLLKVAAGVMNTHSSMADGRMECLAAYGAACGADRDMVRQILNCVTVDGALKILEERSGLRDAVMAMAMERIHLHLTHRAGGRLTVEALLFTNDRGVLGMTPGAAQMIQELSESVGQAGRKRSISTGKEGEEDEEGQALRRQCWAGGSGADDAQGSAHDPRSGCDRISRQREGDVYRLSDRETDGTGDRGKGMPSDPDAHDKG